MHGAIRKLRYNVYERERVTELAKQTIGLIIFDLVGVALPICKWSRPFRRARTSGTILVRGEVATNHN